MRRLLDLITLGCLIVVLLAMVLHHRRESLLQQGVEAARTSVERIQAEIDLMRAIGGADAESPAALDPRRFAEGLPGNPLLDGERPWIDFAKPGEVTLRHPRVWQVEQGSEAMFWFNPVQGVVRARVPRQASEDRARRLYAEVNGAWLD
jgi:hypothetical protein